MSPADAATLLAGIAAYDNRRPDETAAKMWAHALDDLRVEDCAQAVIEHFKTSDDYLMPIHVRRIVKRIRAKRIADHAPVTPPPGLEPHQFAQWKRELDRRIGDGEQIDPDYAYAGQLVKRDMRELLMATPMKTIDEEATA